MGWQGRASCLTSLVLLWFMTQGTLAVAQAPGVHAVVDDPETEMWSLVRNSLHPADVAAFLQAYPNGKYAPAARLKLQQLQRPQAPPRPQGMFLPVPPAGVPEPLSAMRNSIGMELVLIPSGEFTMGSDSYQLEERPMHRVVISKPF
jgi:formylglycine-generating enzyme required for sulfatase activity